MKIDLRLLLFLSILVGNYSFAQTKSKNSANEYVQCLKCEGSGKTEAYCPHCADWSQEYRRKVPCHYCKDTRFITITCQVCKGKGKVPFSRFSSIEDKFEDQNHKVIGYADKIGNKFYDKNNKEDLRYFYFETDYSTGDKQLMFSGRNFSKIKIDHSEDYKVFTLRYDEAIIGKIEEDGTIRNAVFAKIGSINSKGEVRDFNGEIIGYSTADKLTTAIRFFFFDYPDKF